MIIVNADDWGLSVTATDAALTCHEAGRITSVSAMVFMEDSARAAGLAKEAGIDAGLHLNLTHPFTGHCPDPLLMACQQRIAAFLTKNKYSILLYNPALREDFRYVYQSQLTEFLRLYGGAPSHVDGHQHKHLCANMLCEEIIARGQKVRRNYTFARGEKGFVNRFYRSQVDRWLARRYRLTDYFFALPPAGELPAIAALSAGGTVEIMAHPARPEEYTILMSDAYHNTLLGYNRGSYAML